MTNLNRELDAIARGHAIIISVCAGLPDVPCGLVYGAQPVDLQHAGVSHGICAVCAAAMRAEMVRSRQSRIAA